MSKVDAIKLIASLPRRNLEVKVSGTNIVRSVNQNRNLFRLGKVDLIKLIKS